MGAEQFEEYVKGKTAAEAFASARERALYDHGHAGYTGTIAEKREFTVMGSALNLEDAQAQARKFMDDSDPRIDDKWGPAGCIEVGTSGEYLFFGWASS